MENYDVLHRIGCGAQGTTFKVRSKVTGEKFAMKCFLHCDSTEEYTRREVINHKDLNHPNVIKLKEVVSDENIVGIVMEYAKGGDLSSILMMEGVFREAKARKIFQELIAGLSYIHFKNICHRDLKTGNILLDSKGNVKIGDFGLSKSSVLHSEPTSLVGTEEYIAPELYALPEEYNGELADVWSCGVVLYFMLSRKYPKHQNAILTSQCMNSLNVSEDGKDLIGRMLAIDPAKRITVKEIKKHTWYLRDLPDSLKEEAQAIYLDNQNMAGKMDKYEQVHILGKGSFGVTYKVRNKMTGDKLAMKCFRRGHTIDQYVEKEIMNQRVLQHPNVIKFEEVVLDDFKLGIVMEYAEKELYEEVLFHGPFAEAKARKMFQMLIAGVSYLHSKSICHRDLKLENILLTEEGVLKICDFGLSKSLQLDSIAQTILGTPSYWAPEIYSRAPGSTYDGKLADIWSCGVVLYKMLSRQNLKRQNENIASSYMNISVTKECKDLIHYMLENIPEKRITIKEIKKHPWYLKDLPMDLTDEAQAIYYYDKNETIVCQSEEEILKIINEAKIVRVSATEEEDKTSTSFQLEGEGELKGTKEMKNGGEVQISTSSQEREDGVENTKEMKNGREAITSASSQLDGEDGLEDTKAMKNVGGQNSTTGKRKYEDYSV